MLYSPSAHTLPGVVSLLRFTYLSFTMSAMSSSDRCSLSITSALPSGNGGLFSAPDLATSCQTCSAICSPRSSSDRATSRGTMVAINSIILCSFLAHLRSLASLSLSDSDELSLLKDAGLFFVFLQLLCTLSLAVLPHCLLLLCACGFNVLLVACNNLYLLTFSFCCLYLCWCLEVLEGLVSHCLILPFHLRTVLS